MAKAKGKFVSFAAQREQCRLNKFTYTEKCGCGQVTLMCNYPFETKEHKKGMCRATTCTDMRKTLAEDVDEILGEEAPEEAVRDVPTCDELDANTLADSGEAPQEVRDEAQITEEDSKGAVRAE